MQANPGTPSLHSTRVLWGRVLTDGLELPPSRVTIAGGRIRSVETAERPGEGDFVVEDGWLAPGLMDLQVNGAGGVDLTSADEPDLALERVARTLARHGVTAFCPTVVSSPPEVILRALAAYGPRAVAGGAEALGIHVEGPFIDPRHRGVHELDCIRLASPDEIGRWLEVRAPAIVTIAPERPGGLEAIRQLSLAGVVVSLGHTGADATQARAGLAAGARMGTHIFNAMPPLHHRWAGVVGGLLASSAVLGLIGDGVHVEPTVVDLVIHRAGTNRVALVSDALSAAGAPAGESRLGNQVVVSDGRTVRRADGTLAGSATLLHKGLRNVRAWLPDITAARLIQVVTQTPATLLGRSDKGRVAPGCDADLIVLDPDFRVRMTLLRGEQVETASG